MTFLAYIDVRPFLFVVGLPVFIFLSILGCKLARARLSTIRAGIISALAFVGMFTVFLTDYSPFMRETERREYWEGKARPFNSPRRNFCDKRAVLPSPLRDCAASGTIHQDQRDRVLICTVNLQELENFQILNRRTEENYGFPGSNSAAIAVINTSGIPNVQ